MVSKTFLILIWMRITLKQTKIKRFREPTCYKCLTRKLKDRTLTKETIMKWKWHLELLLCRGNSNSEIIKFQSIISKVVQPWACLQKWKGICRWWMMVFRIGLTLIWPRNKWWEIFRLGLFQVLYLSKILRELKICQKFFTNKWMVLTKI